MGTVRSSRRGKFGVEVVAWPGVEAWLGWGAEVVEAYARGVLVLGLGMDSGFWVRKFLGELNGLGRTVFSKGSSSMSG